MEILKFENSQRPVRKKSSSSKVVLGLASIAAVALLGSTLAASISLNGDQNVEFGQGVAQTTACDSSITTTPQAEFVNAPNGGSFNLATVSFSDIADACDGKTFILRAYETTSATPLKLATDSTSSYDQATFTYASTGTSVFGPGLTGTTTGGSSNEGSLSIGFQGTQATSGAVAKLTLESQ